MTTFLVGYRALMLRASIVLSVAVLLLITWGVETALGADTLSATPLPQPDSGGLTMAWLRDFAIFIACIVLIGVFVWRVTVIDRLQEMGAAILHDELVKRGLVRAVPEAAPLDLDDSDKAWANDWETKADEAQRPVRQRPQVVPKEKTAKEMAATLVRDDKFTARTRAKGHA